MASKSSYQELVQQIDSLTRELDECRIALEIYRNNKFKYRSLVENANESILVIQEGISNFANPSAENLFGYSEKELAARPLTDFIHQEDINMVLERYERSLQGEKLPDVYPFRIVNKDGTVKWVELKMELFSWNSQPATLWFMTDITKLKQAEKKYRRLLESTSQGFLLLDADLIINDTNKALLQMSGYRREDFIGQRVDQFYDKMTVDFYSASRNHLSFEAQFHSEAGQGIPMLFSRSILRDDDGRITGYMYFLTDLTELVAARNELKRAEQRYRSMYQNALQGMFQSSLSGKLIRVNPSYARILGYDSPGEVLAIKEGSAKFYFNSDDSDKMIRALRKTGYLTNYEVRLKRKDGKPVWILANIRLIKDETGEDVFEGILVDNTKKKKLERDLRRGREKFRKLSVRDNLTGLYNTRFLYQALDDLIMESTSTDKPFSLIFMDLDNFKHVVDTYGHLNGSIALSEVAQTIKASIEKPCFGVAYGGDEFVIVLPGFNKTQAQEKAEKIRSQMKQTAYLTSKALAVRLSASFGLATFPEDTDNRSGLLALADKAMFHIKQSSKDAVGTIL